MVRDNYELRRTCCAAGVSLSDDPVLLALARAAMASAGVSRFGGTARDQLRSTTADTPRPITQKRRKIGPHGRTVKNDRSPHDPSFAFACDDHRRSSAAHP